MSKWFLNSIKISKLDEGGWGWFLGGWVKLDRIMWSYVKFFESIGRKRGSR